LISQNSFQIGAFDSSRFNLPKQSTATDLSTNRIFINKFCG